MRSDKPWCAMVFMNICMVTMELVTMDKLKMTMGITLHGPSWYSEAQLIFLRFFNGVPDA